VTKFLLSVHVLASIIAIGPVTVAAGMFPRYVRLAHGSPADPKAVPVLRVLHRVCRVYAAFGVVVPVFGLATALRLGVLGDAWLIISIVLTAFAATVLVAVVLPGQHRAIAAAEVPDSGQVSRISARLGMTAGIFSLLWAVVVVLMIVRPGSTTGV
jgi:hypothetical protein